MKRGELAVLDKYIRGAGQGQMTRGGAKDKERLAARSSSSPTLQQQQRESLSAELAQNSMLSSMDSTIQSTASQSQVRFATNNNNNSSQKSNNNNRINNNNNSKEDDDELRDKYRGNVLIAIADKETAERVRALLSETFFNSLWARDGREATNELLSHWENIDCVIVERDLPLVDCFGLCKSLRQHEKTLREQRAAVSITQNAYNEKFLNHRLPFLCFTAHTAPADLTQYMRADMDGCISSSPLDKISLLNTVRAAVPQHLAPLTTILSPPPKKNPARVMKLGALGELEGSDDSATMALRTLPMLPGGGGGSLSSSQTHNTQGNTLATDPGSEVQGIAQLDADTKLPFLVINGSKFSRVRASMKNERFFNLVVCHDIFDTFERVKILLQPIVQRYQGIQILVWNYPGQAQSEWRSTQTLNNEYLAACLNALLGQVGDKGTRDFTTDEPFYLLGLGYGANIATYYLAHYRAPFVRGLINANGFAFVDSYLAGVMHDCVNVFQSTPESRPDLPVYFFSRFLFSKDYLAKVSVPLALNIYTAVYNAISIKGRIQLCKGVLQSGDIRHLLKAIDTPIICLQSNQDSFVRPLHSEPFVSHRFGEARSIHSVLQQQNKTCVVWFHGGHELLQENKKQVLLLLEQILTGYHEVNEVTFPTAKNLMNDKDFAKTLPGAASSVNAAQDSVSGGTSLEDKFTKSVLSFTQSGQFITPSSSSSSLPAIHNAHSSTARATTSKETNNPSSRSHTAKGQTHTHTVDGSSSQTIDRDANWQQFSEHLVQKQHHVLTLNSTADGASSKKTNKNNATNKNSSNNNTQANTQNSTSYLTDVQSFPEVKEYMNWRLKRNKKRLQRLQVAAQCIQSAYRAHLARKFVRNIRRKHAALQIQRVFRGWLGRRRFFHHVKRLWATISIQKVWRGYSARLWYFNVRLKIAAAANIQRMFRGCLARERVRRIREQRHKAACVIQAMMRRYKARKEAWLKRHFRNSATTIQRVFRGFLGKKRAATERDKYIFSKSQSQGIEFGRQMLLEHKLHVTKLQSDVTLLTQEKVASEEQIEALLEEITAFEDGVRSLEKEMHQLSKVESEAAAFMDEDSKFELREQKMRLDREFGEMLSKIASRKEMLNELEKKLATIDKTRQAKEEDLRTLERKLVVLLEDQQKELNAIRRKQDLRGAMLAASHAELAKVTAGEGVPGGNTVSAKSGALSAMGGGHGGGGSGPSLQEKKQAAQLMQSTETLMKFGFMSMSMTYFSSLNMIKALRTVSAQDTVMAALADVHAQRAVGMSSEGSVASSSTGGKSTNPATALLDRDSAVSKLKRGQLPGQQALKVSSWSVEDVANWLQTLSLGQYSEAFIDSAIDGEFLYDLNDDDLKNTLGIEHRLHRKKILNCVNRLKMAEAQNDSRIGKFHGVSAREDGSVAAESVGNRSQGLQGMPAPDQFNFPDGVKGGPDSDDRAIDGPRVPLSELFSYVRHSKFGLLKDAIDYLPNKPFDKALVQSPYVPDHGTAYLLGYDRLAFHINKTDDYGNTMLSMACQNGNAKICKYLLMKGANPNHQNFQGQTPAHFAIAFKFFDLSQWLFENGADDTIENRFGLSPYDGLTTDGNDETAGNLLMDG